MLLVVVDELNKSLTDRELLILVTERLTTLNGKLDEYRQDNSAKYTLLQEEVKCSCERLQAQIDAVNSDMTKMKNMSYMQKGAYMAIGALVSVVGTIGAFVMYF